MTKMWCKYKWNKTQRFLFVNVDFVGKSDLEMSLVMLDSRLRFTFCTLESHYKTHQLCDTLWLAVEGSGEYQVNT